MSHIYLIRHGQASFDAEDYDQLSPLGEEQSRLLGDWMRHSGQQLDQVVIGVNRRHRQTAQQCLQHYRKAPNDFSENDWTLDRGFNEFDHEEVILKYCTEFSDFSAFKQFLNKQTNPHRTLQTMFSAAMQRWTGGEHDDYRESWVEFQTRCRLALSGLIASAGEQENIWIFTSGGTISVLLQDLLGIPNQRIFDLNASLINTGVSKLRVSSDRLRLHYLNNPAHLEIHQRSDLISYR